MAPEIFDRRPYEGVSVDLFAAGVILFIMRTGSPPIGRAVKNDYWYKNFCFNPRKFWMEHENYLKDMDTL